MSSLSTASSRVVTLLIAALLATALLLIVARWAQERITYQPPRSGGPDPAAAVREPYIASDGQPLFALVVRPSSASTAPPARFLLAFHGNADLAVWMVPWAMEVARRTGITVVLAEYRGYGGLPGRPTAAGIRLDARAAAEFARAKFGPAARFDLYGHSLGSAVATELAGEVEPMVLVLEAPFTSARAMAANFGTRLLSMLWPVIGRIPYDTEERVQHLDIPVWVAHGERDRVVAVRMGRAVYAAAKQKGELLIVPGGTHNALADAGGVAYWSWLDHALR